MATQSSLSLLTCEVLRLRQMEAKLPTRGNKAALVQRLLAHEGACDSELSEEDEQDGESSSSSSKNREPSDPVPTDGPSGSRLPCGLGSRAPPREPCSPGGSRNSDDSEESSGRGCSQRSVPFCSPGRASP